MLINFGGLCMAEKTEQNIQAVLQLLGLIVCTVP